MSRPLPRCARCGATLARRGRITVTYRDLPGRPTVGWCIEHPDYSQVRGESMANNNLVDPGSSRGLVAALRRIAALGEGRLVAGPAWDRQHGQDEEA